MKIKGKKVEGKHVQTIVLPRGEGPPLAFKAQAVLSYDAFDAMCKEPKPAKVSKPGVEGWTEDPNDPEYIKAWSEWYDLRYDWLVLQSLEATDGLEWETVDKSKPETWKNWRIELGSAGLVPREIGLIFRGVQEANCLDEAIIKKARESFFRSQQAPSLKT